MMGNTQVPIFASLDKDEARAYFLDAQRRIDSGEKEDVLRYLFCTQLASMFPNKPWWIEEHAARSESNSTYQVDGKTRHGFVDVLIGKTAVEYEKNLNNKSVYTEGYTQVLDYCAGLINEGTPEKDIVGILSDTVRWYAYAVEVTKRPPDGQKYGRDNIRLIAVDSLDMSKPTDENLGHFERFINAYYGRLASRRLTARSLADDFGLTSPRSEDFLSSISSVVGAACRDNPQYADLVKHLWNGLVNAYGDESDDDFLEDYAHELYVVTLAKLLCADILDETVELNEDAVKAILDGGAFRDKGVENFVEYDYFGWLNSSPYVDQLADIAAELQESLTVYDFSRIDTEDLFGPLLAQLAGHDRRTLLGQAPTPPWLAGTMVDTMLDRLGYDGTRLLDMCCGSGVFLVETLKKFIQHEGGTENLNAHQRECIYGAATGIDIDPLAVVLSKANWLIVMRNLVTDFPAGLRIPIYNADSIFAITPVSRPSDEKDADDYRLRLDSRLVALPTFLFEPPHHALCDSLIELSERIALVHANHGDNVSESEALNIARTAISKSGDTLSVADEQRLSKAVFELCNALVYLQEQGRNGIWPFIISNSYMPDIMRGRFSGIVSNPPWLALSKIGGNPYMDILKRFSSEYGVSSNGSSFLHTELATVFFVASANRYLQPDGLISCILPNSVLVGRSQEQFRLGGYKTSPKPTNLTLTEIWQVPKSVFKNKAAVIFARKEATDTFDGKETVTGRQYHDDGSYDSESYKLIESGGLSAIVCGEHSLKTIPAEVHFEQGFDAMPRTMVLYDVERQGNGLYTISSIAKHNEKLSYLLSGAKKATDFTIPKTANMNGRYLCKTLLSTQTLPFFHNEPIDAFLPFNLNGGSVHMLTDYELEADPVVKRMLERILANREHNGRPTFASYAEFLEKVDIRGKLSKALASEDPWYVLYGAGGQDISACAFDRTTLPTGRKFAPDQTLYWHGCGSRDEAIFYTGMLNSEHLNNSIKDFQPEGNFGRRHVHKLPLMFLPEFQSDNESHRNVIDKTKSLINELNFKLSVDKSLQRLTDPNRGTLANRRLRFRNEIKKLESYKDYEAACREAL